MVQDPIPISFLTFEEEKLRDVEEKSYEQIENEQRIRVRLLKDRFKKREGKPSNFELNQGLQNGCLVRTRKVFRQIVKMLKKDDGKTLTKYIGQQDFEDI